VAAHWKKREDLMYRLAKHVRDTDDSEDARAILAEIRALDPGKYERKTQNT
jgi:hemerythrin superfamily protein